VSKYIVVRHEKVNGTEKIDIRIISTRNINFIEISEILEIPPVPSVKIFIKRIGTAKKIFIIRNINPKPTKSHKIRVNIVLIAFFLVIYLLRFCAVLKEYFKITVSNGEKIHFEEKIAETANKSI
jgi:hypothetical protein